MLKVTVSPKFQIVIPREVRDSLCIKPGEELQVFRYGDRIELAPVRSIREMRGFLKGIDTTVERDPDRRPDESSSTATSPWAPEPR